MNITQLRYFHAVATYHTVSLAAQHSYISQPSLSNAIKELEREFSVTLFYRRYNGMFLTPEGTKLYNSTKELLEQYGEVEEMMRGIGRGEDKLRLGIPPMLSSFIFPELYKHFGSDGGARLVITERGHYELLDRLNEDLVDIVILPHTKPFDVTLSAKKVGTLDIVLCTSRNNPLSEQSDANAEMLDGEPLVLLPDTFFQTRTIKRWFSRAGVTPSVALETEQISTALGMIERGCLSGFMFERLVKRNPALASVPLSPRVRVDISVIRKKGAYVSREMERLERFLMESDIFDM